MSFPLVHCASADMQAMSVLSGIAAHPGKTRMLDKREYVDLIRKEGN